MGNKLDAVLGVLNGAVGDHLAKTGNGLATEMQWVQGGKPLEAGREALARALPSPSGKVVVLVHGLMETEVTWTFADGSDYGKLLQRDFGFTPLYVRYNSGRPIADNGASLAKLLNALLDDYPAPIDELLLLGFSMGGLVIRSACHVAKQENLPWLGRVRRAIYVGTPHLGAPLERAGRVLAKVLRSINDPYVQLLAQLGDLRSAGLQDLGDADLRHEDRERRIARFSLRDERHPVPLLPEIQHHLVAGSFSPSPTLALLFGDALVPVPSATAGACRDPEAMALPPSNIRIFNGVVHPSLAHDPEVYAQIRSWMENSR